MRSSSTNLAQKDTEMNSILGYYILRRAWEHCQANHDWPGCSLISDHILDFADDLQSPVGVKLIELIIAWQNDDRE